MKTAVSIPDKLFRAADRLAKNLGISRSELYARALQRYLDEDDQSWVTERLNEIYGSGDVDNSLDPALDAAAREVFARLDEEEREAEAERRADDEEAA